MAEIIQEPHSLLPSSFLSVESIYFTILNNKIAEGLTAIPDLVDAYRGDFDKIKELAGEYP